jgi:single-stranded DNA-binding protein
MINATITGRAGKDPETKDVGGRQLVTFSVASNNRKDGATWIRVSVWSEQLGRFVSDKVRKGARVALVGLLEERSWGDNGENKALELNCSNVELYDWPEGGSVSPGISAPRQAPKPKAAPAPRQDVSDLPF